MNRITRMLAIAGMGIGAALALAGPAQAATADVAHKAPVSTKAHFDDDDRIVGFYDDPITCNRVGRIGEARGRWDDYDCHIVRFGFHRGDWALSVDDDDWDGPFHHGPFGGPFGGPFHHGPFGGPFHHGPFGGPFHHGPFGGPFHHGPFGGPFHHGPFPGRR
jgi:hypothetical protein